MHADPCAPRLCLPHVRSVSACAPTAPGPPHVQTIDDCDNKTNKWLTVAGYVHICYQPYFTHVINSALTKSKRVLTMYGTFDIVSDHFPRISLLDPTLRRVDIARVAWST